MDLDLLIPTHNRTGLLNKCLESVMRANVPAGLHVNVVVVDNNSSDNTARLAASFAGKTPQCRYIFVGKPGKSAALNEALSQTTSELVGMIDDDEEIDPDWFTVAFREFQDPDLEYIGGPYLPNWEAPPPDWLPDGFKGVIGVVPRPERVPFSPDFPGILMGGNIVIRRKTLEKILPYPEKIGKIGNRIRSGQDEAAYHRLLKIGAKGMVIPDLKIYHWIPVSRMTRRYFRRWSLGRGIGVGAQHRERRYHGANLLGLPRYRFGAAFRDVKRFVAARDQSERFAAELGLRDFVGLLYGRYLYGRF